MSHNKKKKPEFPPPVMTRILTQVGTVEILEFASLSDEAVGASESKVD